LIEAGELVARHRADYVNVLRSYARRAGERLLGGDVALDLRAGWDVEQSLAEALANSWARDVERQQTSVGPHRAELLIRLDGAPARGRVSRGQQKLLASTLLLAQLQCDQNRGSKLAVLLVDDPAAELDSLHLQALLAEIGALRCQLFVTALDPKTMLIDALSPGRRFHVEHGKVAALL
jgi:DNA replication and repair protein RecF